jgi:phage FluMu gp28-like protein
MNDAITLQPGDPHWITLLPYQEEAIARARGTSLFVCEKSRRTGMTLAFAHEAVAIASAAQGAMNVFYLSYNQDMTREFMDDCAQFCDQALAQGADFKHKVTRKRIEFPGNKAISALNSAPRSLRGKQGMVIIDEAAFVNDLPEVMKAAKALIMWGGRIVVISTHNGAENAFSGLVEDVRMERTPGDVMRLTLNDALDQGLHKCISKAANQNWSETAQSEWETNLRASYGESAAEELDVIPARAPATWLDRPTIEAAMTKEHKVIRLNLPEELNLQTTRERTEWMEDWIDHNVTPLIANFDSIKPSFFGQDFARSSDLSVIMAGQFDDDAVLQCLINIEMRGVHFDLQLQLLRNLCNAMPEFTAGYMDAGGNGADIAEKMQQEFGKTHITCIKATDASYHAMMPRLKRRIEDCTIAMPRDEGVVTDLRLVRMKNGTPRISERTSINIDGAKNRRHGDTTIALMHLVAAADEPPQLVEVQLMGERDSSGNGFRIGDGDTAGY